MSNKARKALGNNISSTLSLRLNYCVRPTTINKMTDGTFTRLTRNTRQMYALRGLTDNGNGDYIPFLYLKSTYEFKKAPSHIEKDMVSFKEGILQKQMLLNQLKWRISSAT